MLLLLVVVRPVVAPPSNFEECNVPKAVKYSASWFASSSLIRGLSHEFLSEKRLLRSGTMMEGASFILFERSTAYKSLDFFDFYVEHLSWYERLLAKPAKETGLGAFARESFRRRVGQQSFTASRRSRGKMVVAVMPFYAAGSGQGPSSVDMRLGYLNATIASIRSSLTDHIAVGVENRRDLDTVRKFDLFDTFYFPSLKSPDKLGVASLIAIHRALTNTTLSSGERRGEWRDVDYVYYTESDQILRMRGDDKRTLLLDQIVDRLGAERAVLVPRRAVPVPLLTDFETSRERDALFEHEDLKPFRTLSKKQHNHEGNSCTCFFERPVCSRMDLRPIDSRSDILVGSSPAGLGILPAEGNFRKLLFQKCRLEC